MASTHQYYQDWSKEFFVKKAAKIGIQTATYVGRLIDQQSYPEIGYKRAQGIIALWKTYPRERIEAACLKASDYHICSWKTIETILKNKTDLLDYPEEQDYKIKQHSNLRDVSNYK
jgi:hypothetical protein